MNSGLDEAYAILDSFEKEIAGIKAGWEQSLEQASSEYWRETYYRMWLHGVTDIWECRELERWLTDYPTNMVIANSCAKKIFAAWRDWLVIAGPIKIEQILDYDKRGCGYVEQEKRRQSEARYAGDGRFEIPKPQQKETLYDFIIRLARWSEGEYDDQQKCARKERKLGDWLEERALKSFLHFVRKSYSAEQVAFIEHIFPQKMDVHYGRIIRLLPPEAYPIPEKTAAEILIELVRRCRVGHPVARHTAIESLALCWLCIASSRIRLPKTLETVRRIQSRAVLSGSEFGISKNRTFGHKEFWRPLMDSDFSVLQVPTWFGDQPLKISNRVAAFLKIIANLPSKKTRITIFQKSRKSLDQMFNLALQSIAPDPKYGKITYLSLLVNQPHIHGDHRYQPKY